MNYFVSIENSSYHGWQIDLLIESFKVLGLEDNLYISEARSDREYITNKNFLNHNKKYVHENIGRKADLLKLNKWAALYTLVENNTIKLPLTVLDPDTVIYKETEIQNEQLIFSIDPSFVYNKRYSKLVKMSEENKDKWPNIGEVLIFNDLPFNFFKDVIAFLQITGLDPRKYQADKVALFAAMCKHKVERVTGSNEIEGDLIDRLGNIISYRHGVNPMFNKKLYKNNGMNFSMAADSPINLLSKMDYTPSLEYVSKVAKRL
jgi:hypothetical protein